jgi:serine/threonine protein kinase
VFVAADLGIKILDFGLSRFKLECSSNSAMSTVTPSIRWRAPETFTKEYLKISNSFVSHICVDMYAYGLLLWEMAIRKKPFHGYLEVKTIELLNLGTREEINSNWPQHFKTLLSNLWSYLPSSKPTAEVLKMFKDPIFKITEARNDYVIGYQCQKSEGIPIIVSGQGYIVPNEVAKDMGIINKRNNYAIPNEIDLPTLIELCRIGLLPFELWKSEIDDLDKSGHLPFLLNAAGILEYKKFYEFGCKYVAEKIKIGLSNPPKPISNKKLLLTFDEERSQSEFEMLILAAIRQKKL